MRLGALVVCIAVVGCGVDGAPSLATPPEPNPVVVAAPVLVRAEPIPGGARVRWQSPPAGTGLPAAHHDVDVEPAAPAASYAWGDTSVDVTSLSEGVTYTFAVTALSGAIRSARVVSNPVTVRGGSAVAGWRQAPALPQGSSHVAPPLAGALGGFLYAVLDGRIHAARLGADGAPGPWTLAASEAGDCPNPSAVAFHERDGGGFVFVHCAGESMSGFRGDLTVAPVRDGVVGAFVKTTPFAPGASGVSLFTFRDRLYVVGGQWWSGGSFTGVGSPLAFVNVADIEADGRLGPWRRAGLLPRAGSFRSVVRGGRLYVLGSRGNGTEVFHAEIAADGAIGGWRRASAQPDLSAHDFGVAATGEFLHLVGHVGAPGVGREEVPVALVARLAPDGDVVSWEPGEAAALAPPVRSLAASGRHLYVAGGVAPEVWWGAIDAATGHVAPLAQPVPRPPSAPLRARASPLPQGAAVEWDAPRDDGGASITDYVVRRWPDGAAVEVDRDGRRATFGALDGWALADGPSFQVFARNAAGEGPGSGPTEAVLPQPSRKWRPSGYGSARPLFAAGATLFAQGGRRIALPLDPEGLPWTQIGPGWEGSTTVLSSFAQAARRVDAATSCAYAVGGRERWITVATTRVTCMRDDGFFGEAVAPPAAADTPIPRSKGAAAIAGGYLYVAGGEQTDPAGSPRVVATLEDVSVAPILADGGVGAWRATTPLPVPIAEPALAARGDDLFLLDGRQVLRARRGADGTLSRWSPSGPALDADAPGARLASSGDVLYVVAPGRFRLARLDGSGDVASWEGDDEAALPFATFELTAANDRLYVVPGWGEAASAALYVARLDPATGRLVAW